MQLRATRLTAIASAVKRAFNIRSLFAGSVQGVWYDPSDMSTLFQDSAGTTPVTAVEQPVGLMLDKSQGLVLGSELVVNGDFSNGTTGWTANGNTLTVSSEKLSVVGNNWSSSVAINVTIGKTYVISFDFQSIAVNPNFRVGYAAGANAELVNVGATQLNAKRYVTPAFSPIYVNIGGGSVGSSSLSDNISVRELPGNHAFQTTAASRPVLSARYNLLTKTEQFDDAVWTKQEVTLTVNATTSPIGGSNGTSIVPSATTNQFRIYRNPDPSVSAQNGIYVKANGYTKVALRDAGGTSGMYAAFNLASVSVIDPGSSANASIVSVGDGWFKISAVFTTAANQRFSLHVLSPSYVSGVVDVTWTANGTSGIYIWGASIVPANQSTLPYQRVNTSTDYATTGFLPYLKFDGVDDSLSTNSISFTSTDKMSVFAGVRKLSDAALGMITELSASVGANNGSFYLVGPSGGSQADYSFVNKGTASAGAGSSGYAAPVTNTLIGLGNISGDLATLRVNGAQVGTNSADQGTGNYGNYPLYIGRRNNASLPFNGQMYSMIIVGKAVTAGELSSTEKFVASKTGVTL